MELPSKISGFRSKPINSILDYLGGEEGDAAGRGGDVPELLRHFHVHIVGPAKVDVHGGRWWRQVGNSNYAIPLTVDGGGTCANSSEVKTLTASAAGYVIATLNSATAPTTLVASIAAAFPSSGLGTTVWPLAEIEWDAATSTISRLEPLWTGGDLGNVITVPDNVSLAFEDNDLLEIHGWEDGAATSPWPAGGEIMGRPSAHGDPFWASVFDAIDSIEDWTGINLDGADLTGTTGTPPAHTHNHVDLADLVAGTGTDDHDGDLASGNYPYVGNRGDYMRNAMSNGLGDSNGSVSVAVADRQLKYDGKVVLDWELGLINDADELDSVDAFLRYLCDDWEVTGTTDTTDGTNGALTVAGGIGAAGHIAAVLGLQVGDGDEISLDETNIKLHASSGLSLAFSTLEINSELWEPKTVNLDIDGVSTPCKVLSRVI